MSQLQVSGEAKIRDIQGPVVANSGVITALDGAASQYVRGDGTLADFPTSTGGGSSVSYYLNSSVSQGTIGGVAYRELSKEPIIGAGTDITISANGYVANYITDANDPDVLSVPGGNFNCEFYFSVNNNTGSPTTYAELYKYDGTTFTLLGSSVGVPESLNQGTTIAPYYFAIPVATAALALTDRIAIRIYANVDGRTVTLHTENSHLCQVVTTFSKGMVSLNNLTDQSQFLTTGTSGTNFNIVSSGDTHTFNLPVASATNTGKLSNTDWSTFNGKVPYTGATSGVDLGAFSLTASTVGAAGFFGLGSGTVSGYIALKQGTTFLGNVTGYNSINAISTKYLLISDIGSTNYKSASFELGSLTNATERTYTLPDLSGTLALLEGTQTFSGTKFFSTAPYAQQGIVLTASATTFSTGNTTLNGNANGLTIGLGVTVGGTTTSYAHQLLFPQITPRTYTYPAASGTVALTSDLSAYLPLTGGTLTGPLSGTTATFSGLGTFNQLTITGATAGRIFYAQTGGVVSQSGNLNWNETNGMLGVGTPNPSAVITAFSTNAATQFKAAGTAPAFTFSNTLTSPTLGCVFGLATASNHFVTGTAAGDMAIANQSTVAGAIVFGTGTTERMRMSAAGRFLINTSVDNGASLQVNGAATFSSSVTANGIMSLGNDGTYGSTYKTLGLTGNSDGSHRIFAGTADDIYIAAATARGIQFWTNGVTSTRMIITSGGNVGIGTSSPSGAAGLALVLNSGASQGRICIKTSATGDASGAGLQIGMAGVDAFIEQRENAALSFATNATERMRITSVGDLLVGTTSNTYVSKLVLFGGASNNTLELVHTGTSDTFNVIFSNGNGAVGSIKTNGSSTSYNTSSDYRLKQDLKEFNGLSLVSAIKTYDYEWKSDNTRAFGVIAHELQEVIPYAVTGEKDGEMMQGVDYSKIVPILVKAIQELNEKIKQLENK